MYGTCNKTNNFNQLKKCTTCNERLDFYHCHEDHMVVNKGLHFPGTQLTYLKTENFEVGRSTLTCFSVLIGIRFHGNSGFLTDWITL